MISKRGAHAQQRTIAVNDGEEEDSVILLVCGVQPPLLQRVLRPLDANVRSVNDADAIAEARGP
jgi:hypothetical protein